MRASDAIKSNNPYSSNARRFDANSRLRSVILDICARYQAAEILGIGPGVLPLCLDLHSAGYTVTIMTPDEESTPHFDDLTPGYRLDSRAMQLGCDQTKRMNFNTAVIMESEKPRLDLSALIEFATLRLQSGSVILLPTPYHGYLQTFLNTASRWWNFLYSIARLNHPVPCWPSKNLQVLLALNGFSIIERIGVRGPALEWQTLIIVAKKL